MQTDKSYWEKKLPNTVIQHCLWRWVMEPGNQVGVELCALWKAYCGLNVSACLVLQCPVVGGNRTGFSMSDFVVLVFFRVLS